MALPNSSKTGKCVLMCLLGYFALKWSVWFYDMHGYSTYLLFLINKTIHLKQYLIVHLVGGSEEILQLNGGSRKKITHSQGELHNLTSCHKKILQHLPPMAINNDWRQLALGIDMFALPHFLGKLSKLTKQTLRMLQTDKLSFFKGIIELVRFIISQENVRSKRLEIRQT